MHYTEFSAEYNLRHSLNCCSKHCPLLCPPPPSLLPGCDYDARSIWKESQIVLTQSIQYKSSQSGMGIGIEANLSSKV